MRRKKRKVWQGLAGILCTAMLVPCISPAFTAKAEGGNSDAQWEKISGIMDTFADKAVWTNTKYDQAITQQMPSTALLGNGEIGATSYGNDTEKTWLLSSNDFWSDNSLYFGYVGRTPQIITGGGLTITPAEAGHEYNLIYGSQVKASSESRDHGAALTAGGLYLKNLNGDGENFTGWEAAETGTPQWILYDLGFNEIMDRLVVRHDNYTSGKGSGRNTKDFEIQTLKNGIKPENAGEEDWVTVEKITGNEADSTEVKLNPAQSFRYLRIYITQATAEGDDGIARIGQLEGYYKNDEYQMPIIDNKGSEHPYNKVYQMPAYASSQTQGHEAEKAVGGVTQAEGWVSDIGQEQYLIVDLKVSTKFNRWHVKHDNYTSRKGADRNTDSFDLQTSADGVNWTKVDSVTGNKADVTDRRLLYDHQARYVKLNITKASQEDDQTARARISQFEIYMDNNYGTSYATLDAGAQAKVSSIMNEARTGDNMINNNWYTEGNGGNDYCGWVSNTNVKPHWAQIDLGTERSIDEIAILHMGMQAHMDDLYATGNKNAPGYQKFTTNNYKVSVSVDGTNWDVLDDITGNKASIYDNKLSKPISARYLRVDIGKSEQSANDRARILKVFAFNNDENPLYSMPLEFTPVEPEPDDNKEVIAPEEAQYNVAYKAEVSVSSESEGYEGKNAVGGVYQYTDDSKEKAFEGWVSMPGQEQYLQLSFPEMIQFSRWHVKHNNATTGKGAVHNTRDFKLEISRDGEKWVTVDQVVDNQEDVTDRQMLYPVSAKYVRLHITKASGEDGGEARARISQFELYQDDDFANSLTMADKGASVTTSSDPYTTQETLISDNFIKLDKNGINDYNGWISVHAQMPQWAKVDLGEVKSFDEVGILFAGAEALVQDLAAGGAVNADNSKYTDAEGNIGYRRFRAKQFNVELSKDGESWDEIGNYTDNRAGEVTIQLPELAEARYIRVNVSQGQQTPASDQRARIGKIYAFNNQETPKVVMPVEEYPVYQEQATAAGQAESVKYAEEEYVSAESAAFVPEEAVVQKEEPAANQTREATPFREEMDIAKAEVRTVMDMGNVPVDMTNWLVADKNIMVTQITSKGDQAQTVDVRPWGKNTLAKTTTDANVLSKPQTIAQSGVSNDTVWATRKSNVEDEIKKSSDGNQTVKAADWMSEFAIASKVLGTDNLKYSSQDNEGIIRVEIPAGETVTVVTAIDCAENQAVDAADGAEGLAVKNVLGLLDEVKSIDDVDNLHEKHLNWWKDYYQLSYADFHDTELNRLYYGSQYIFACCTREGSQAPGLYGVWTTRDNSGWQGDYHLNYNFQSPYYGSYSSNRLKEFSQPMFDVFIEYMDTGIERAANPEHLKSISSWYYGTREEDFKNGFEDALLLPVGLKPFKVSSDDASYLNQTINALFCASQICAYYNYTLDKEWLMKKQESASGNLYSPYDFLVKTANFYEQWVEKRGARVDDEFVKDNPCSDAGGQSQTTKYTKNYEKYPEYDGTGEYTYVLFDGSHEGSFEFNPNVTIGNLQNLLDTLVGIGSEAAPSQEKFGVWQDISTHLPGMEVSIYEYQGFNANSQKNSNYLGKEIFGLSEDRKIRPISATVNLEGIQPGDQLGFDSDPYLLEVARNTVNVCGNDGAAYGSAGWNMVNNTPKIFTHAARVQYDAATLVSKIKQYVVKKMAGNYYVDDNTHGWEKVGVMEALNDMMVYSDNGFIKTFPTWTGNDAEFQDIRVKGAFLVSAEMKEGTVPSIHITSEKGTDAKVVIPWDGAFVTREDGSLVSTAYGETENSKEKTIEFSTEPGTSYIIHELGNNEELLDILEKMLVDAESAKASAEAAQQKAEEEKIAAEAAKKAAEEAKAAAEAAQNAADQDAEAAKEALAKAEAARAEAVKAQEKAEEAKKAAEAAKTAAQEAQSKTEATKEEIVRLKAAAEEAQKQAEAEKQAAEEARKQAEAEKQAAEEAKKQAEAEKQAAETARQRAEEERKAAEEAKKSAQEAQAKAEEAKKAAEEVHKKVEAARDAAQEAQRKAEEAQKAAQKGSTDTVTSLKKGKIYQSGSLKYKITKLTSGSKTVSVTGTTNKNIKKLTIPSTVTIQKVKFKVTEIGSKAFKNRRTLEKVTIGSNVKKIGSQAFYGTKGLKNITIKSKGLNSVGKNAWKGISTKAVISVPKSKVNTYTKLFSGKGQAKTVKITK